MHKKIFNWLNDLNSRGLGILAASVFLIMFAVLFFFLSWWTDKKNAELDELRPAVVSMQTVVVAKTDIPPLTIIKKEMLQLKEVPEELVPSDVITNMSKIVDTTSKTEIFSGDVITKRKLFTDLDSLTFVGSIPADCRAVSVSVNEVTGVNGFAKAGDKVDLLLVETDENFSAAANVLLQDVLLLGINKDMSKDSAAEVSKDGKVKAAAIDNPAIATLALRPDEVLKLISAAKLGEIYLILRPQNPTEKYFDSAGYYIDSINAYKRQKNSEPAETPAIQQTPPVTAAPITPPEDPNKIEIIQGDEIVK